MAFDFKKEDKALYQPGQAPSIVDVPAMNFIAVRGEGDPNEENGAYQQAVSVLYAVAYTLRMSPKAGRQIDGYFAYVVPPLEGFWWQEGVTGVNDADKASFRWIAVIRLPEFVTRDDFDWAVAEAARKKKMDCSSAEMLTLREGVCVQMMHLGPFDDEPASVAQMDAFIAAQGYVSDFSDARLHHEIYLSDPRRTPAEKWRTIIRHPVRRA